MDGVGLVEDPEGDPRQTAEAAAEGTSADGFVVRSIHRR